MKVISWNVNGLRAAIEHGALDFLKSTRADVILLQEVKTDGMLRAAEIDAICSIMIVTF